MSAFWVRQTHARRNTAWLVLLYIALLLVFSALAAWGVNALWEAAAGPGVPAYRYTNGLRFFIIMLVIPAAVGVMTLFSPASLSAGGKSVAEAMGGALISPQTGDLHERRLLNVVEEMAIASGMPVPPVYLLQKEGSINAFAAGRTINDAVIGVTRGTLDYLTREELQAVIAHEFSHILNEDMRLNLRFARLIFGLMCMAEFGKIIIHGLSRSGRGGRDGAKAKAVIFCLALVCLLFGLLTRFLGVIIQAAVNRQREYLADASAVQFTRSPALASALKKIGGLDRGSELRETMAGTYSHFFFCRVSPGLLSSHPPLEERILLIEPGWNRVYPAVHKLTGEESLPRREQPSPTTLAAPAAGSFAAVGDISGGRAVRTLSSKPVNPGEAEDKLHAAGREPLDACRMILGLLLDDDPAIQAKQLGDDTPEKTEAALREYKRTFALVPLGEHLPFIEAAIPAMKRLSFAQYEAFYNLMRRFCLADESISFKEWLLYRLIVSQVGAQFIPARKPFPFPGAPKRTEDAARLLLAGLARLDTREDAQRHAFEQGLRAMRFTVSPLPPMPAMDALDKSLAILQESREQTREAFLHAAMQTVAADGVLTAREGIFLRIVSLCLALPLSREVWLERKNASGKAKRLG